ncbi:hypothetical protein GXW74_15670 [Roseomonas eburnea]|uniref:Uncharacterized protein n=1 Tax=Neoroseomonas eburnea TaxID=1346889 RepID=A0A9X9XDZ7_9PROT|nr:hypothetical protein [Neoroseomonas eburnea]MBR0681933.1 hypothetical protein [Neoroseomonas eburnea]
MLPKSGRTFSRATVIANCAAAWIVVVVAILRGEGVAGIVVPAAMTLIAWLVAGYMGVGAVDFRTAVSAARRPEEAPRP